MNIVKNRYKLLMLLLSSIGVAMLYKICFMDSGEINAAFFTKMICICLLASFAGLHFLYDINKLYGFIYKHRYWCAFGLFVLGVGLNLNGSSIGMWGEYITGNTNSGTLFGQARLYRSDEWAVFTPMLISQVYNKFQYFSEILRGMATDTAVVYALPILGLPTVFRPFLAGFILFGIERGLAFFWCGRLIILFLVTFEFSMLVTGRKKRLALMSAVMVAFAPVVQWWFAINGLVEMIIFGELAVLLLYKYMNTIALKKRILYLAGLFICAGGYVLTIYPAWMIPLAYAFLVFAVWVLADNWKNCRMRWFDWMSVLVVIVLFGGSMLYIFMKSSETIQAVMNTAYPGKRISTGGYGLDMYFKAFQNIFMPFLEFGNQCERAVFFDCFPIGIILTGWVLLKEKKRDILLILLSIVYVILSVYVIFGFPEILAQLTALSFSTANRTYLAVGFINIFMMIRALAIMEKQIQKFAAFITSMLLSCVMMYCYCFRYDYRDFYDGYFLVVILILSAAVYYQLLVNRKGKNVLLILITGIMIISGACVNPVQQGIGGIDDTRLAKQIKAVQNEDSGIWMVENMGFPYNNYLLLLGIPVINSTNIYPAMDRWQSLDKEKRYEEVYNRYAHIFLNVNELYDDKFELLSTDNFKANLMVDELKPLNVKYIWTNRDLSSYDNQSVEFAMLSDIDGNYIYKVIYEDENKNGK